MLPSLKFLFAFKEHIDPARLREKLESNLNDLKYFDHATYFPRFNYSNWNLYLQNREQLKYWPAEFNLGFTKLVNYEVPFSPFEDNFLQIAGLAVRHVTDQQPLIEFLRNVKIERLFLDYGFNLGQSFFDEITDFLTVEFLNSFESAWSGVSDLSVLSKLNVCHFCLYVKQELLPHQHPVISSILRNPFCLTLEIRPYTGWENYEGWLGFENHKVPVESSRAWHRIKKSKNEFHCEKCDWTCTPNCFEDSLMEIINHIEIDRSIKLPDGERPTLLELLCSASSRTFSV